MIPTNQTWTDRGRRFLALSVLVYSVAILLLYLTDKIWSERLGMGLLAVLGISLLLFGWLLVIAIAYCFLPLILWRRRQPTAEQTNRVWNWFFFSYAIVPSAIVLLWAYACYTNPCRDETLRQLPENCMMCCDALVGDCGC